MPSIGPEIQVACALIWRDGHLLLSKRHQHAHQGGRWEFPGGKFESDELASDCLTRELQEELGITPRDAHFMFQIPWDYGDKAIRLWVYEIFEFEGEPQGREGQLTDWFTADALGDLQFPEANQAIVRAVGLSRTARIYNPSNGLDPVIWATQAEYPSLNYFRGLVPGRELDMAIESALNCGHQVILTLDQLGCFVDGCGVHLRKTDRVTEALASLDRLHQPWPITSGVRDEFDIERQQAWPSDAVFISPVRETPSHDGMRSLGWERFSELAVKIGIPSYALGGITKDDLQTTLKYFGYGVAGIRGFQ